MPRGRKSGGAIKVRRGQPGAEGNGGKKEGNAARNPRKMKSFPRISASSPSLSKFTHSGSSSSAGSNRSSAHGPGLDRQKQKQSRPKQQQSLPIVPFEKRDRILLVGEGMINVLFASSSLPLVSFVTFVIMDIRVWVYIHRRR
jgi:hypothetical protein